MYNSYMSKLIIILGPTASGKTSLSIRLAKKFNGEVISADSRQIYKHLRIGSSVITEKETQGIKHHLVEFLDPQKTFSAGEFQKLARKKIKEIEKRKKLPFIVGGTGFYIDAMTENKILTKVKPNKKLRQQLESKTPKELLRILKKANLERAAVIDKNNPRRLIRAIEIASASPMFNVSRFMLHENYNVLYLGVSKPPQKLKKDIEARFVQWLENGFLKEVEKLIKLGIPSKKFKELGLHYWLAYSFLKNKISFKEFYEKSLFSLWHYAKRQNTWFKKNKKIRWITTEKQAETLLERFLNATKPQIFRSSSL